MRVVHVQSSCWLRTFALKSYFQRRINGCVLRVNIRMCSQEQSEVKASQISRDTEEEQGVHIRL